MDDNRSVVVFDHDVEALELVEAIPKNFTGDIVIHGNLTFNYMGEKQFTNRIEFPGNLTVDGNINMEDAILSVDGELVCGGSIVAMEIKAKTLSCINTDSIRVRRKLTAINVYCNFLHACIVELKGDLVCSASEIDSMHLNGNYYGKETRVESAIINGNFFNKGRVNAVSMMVAKDFSCEGVADVFDLVVCGNAKVADDLYCRDAKIGGNLECKYALASRNAIIHGDLTCEEYVIDAVNVKGEICVKTEKNTSTEG